jgi:hypothetical protein
MHERAHAIFYGYSIGNKTAMTAKAVRFAEYPSSDLQASRFEEEAAAHNESLPAVRLLFRRGWCEQLDGQRQRVFWM